MGVFVDETAAKSAFNFNLLGLQQVNVKNQLLTLI